MNARLLLPFLVLALTTALAATPRPLDAQLRPDRRALETAKSMKTDKRASATEVASALRQMRRTEAEVTAVLHRVGYAARDIGRVHMDLYRMGARESARTSMTALADEALAFAVMVEVTRDRAELIRTARTDLRMGARATLESMQAQRVAARTNVQRAYADLKAGGFSVGAVIVGIVEEWGGTPSEVYDAMATEGASLPEIAQELMGTMGQSVTQVRELFAAKGVDTAAGAAALDAVGASPLDIYFFVFREWASS